ncbi:MAG TPA: hypothetical protein VJ719_09225 [Chthoniobacterales bacterium]|nr:hypothetical protein [Chthoniobacterales bacterium]
MNVPKTVVLLSVIAIALSLSSCVQLFGKRSKPAATNHALYAVKTDKTPFYRFGPQQVNGPDRDLSRDTTVTVIRRSMGYSKVRLEDGEEGFVASEDLSRAREKLIAHADTSAGPDLSHLPPPPPVQLPVADPPSSEFEPSPLPQPLLP